MNHTGLQTEQIAQAFHGQITVSRLKQDGNMTFRKRLQRRIYLRRRNVFDLKHRLGRAVYGEEQMILLIRERRNRNLHLLHEGGRAEQHLPITDARTIAAVFIESVQKFVHKCLLYDLFCFEK